MAGQHVAAGKAGVMKALRLSESEIRIGGLEILRAAETWQQAGAYYVRIQAMARKHHIPLRQEFDEHDTPRTKYIVALDSGFPVATARMYGLDKGSVMIGRIVVLPEYRHRGIGTLVVTECEKWAAELGFEKALLESRENKVRFYRNLGYEECGDPVIEGDTFRCIRMGKPLSLERPAKNGASFNKTAAILKGEAIQEERSVNSDIA